MNTLAPHPPEAQHFHPDNQANRNVVAQDPWSDAPEHSGDLSPLPHMSPAQEAAAFSEIADDLKDLATPQDPWAENAAPIPNAPTPTNDEERQYTPRHLRLNDDESFTPTPASDIERRNQANLKATLGLRETLGRAEPLLLAEATEAAAGERPANYKGRRRLLGRFARLFSR